MTMRRHKQAGEVIGPAYHPCAHCKKTINGREVEVRCASGVLRYVHAACKGAWKREAAKPPKPLTADSFRDR